MSNNWKICANEHKICISRLKNCSSKLNLCVSTEQNKILNKSTCQPIEKVNYIMDGNFVWLLVPTRLISDFRLVATYVRLEESRWDICSMMNRPIGIQPFSEKAICGFKMLITSKPFIRWVWNSVSQSNVDLLYNFYFMHGYLISTPSGRKSRYKIFATLCKNDREGGRRGVRIFLN